MIRSLVITALVLALAGCGGEEVADATLVTIEKGQGSSITSARTQVIYTQAELDALWLQHDPGNPAPTIDFDKHMVIAAFQGFAPSGGYSIHILSADAAGGTLNVSVEYRVPITGCGAGAVVLYPYHIVRRARTDIPAVFSSNTVNSC
jgi:hypothetical protein